MKKTIVAALTVATVAGSLVTATPSAQAHDGVGAGIAAGLLGGAIIGGAIASSRPAYGGPVYVAEPAPPPATLLLAAPAVLGRLRLGRSPGSRLLLI
ncbi:hypothetical protein ACVWXP_000454 [Bradyrhizobium sp. USDA 4463]